MRTTSLSLLLSLLAGLGCGQIDVSGRPDEARSLGVGFSDYTVEHYDIGVDLIADAADSTLTIRALETGDCLSIPYRSGAVTDVRLAGDPATSWSRVDGRIEACTTGGAWTSGESVELVVHHELSENTLGGSQVGFSTRYDSGYAFEYLQSWVGECDRLGPCDTRPDRFATWRFDVTHAQTTQVLCPGQIEAAPGHTVCTFDYAGGPAYSTYAVLAYPAWTRTELGTSPSGIQLSVYDLPSTSVANDLDETAVTGFLEWMIETFGDWPYGDRLRLVMVPLYWGGFEHPGTIALSRTLSGNRLTHTTLHEIAHQWAGNLTTLEGTYDFVWKEATVEYLSFVYEDEQMGSTLGRSTVQGWKSGARFSDYYPVPAGQPELFDYYGDVYEAGPMVLYRQLELRYGRDAILAALQQALGTERTLSVAELEQALEQTTGDDLSEYFDAWVYGSGSPTWPTVTVSLTPQPAGTTSARVSLQDADGVARDAAFFVRFDQSSLGPRDILFYAGENAPQQAQLDDAVTATSIDPYTHALVYPATFARPAGHANPWVAEP